MYKSLLSLPSSQGESLPGWVTANVESEPESGKGKGQREGSGWLLTPSGLQMVPPLPAWCLLSCHNSHVSKKTPLPFRKHLTYLHILFPPLSHRTGPKPPDYKPACLYYSPTYTQHLTSNRWYSIAVKGMPGALWKYLCLLKSQLNVPRPTWFQVKMFSSTSITWWESSKDTETSIDTSSQVHTDQKLPPCMWIACTCCQQTTEL